MHLHGGRRNRVMVALSFGIPGDGAFFGPRGRGRKKRLVLDGFMIPLHMEVYPWDYLGTRAQDLVHSD